MTIHAEEPVPGVIGQTAIHLRDVGEEEYDELEEQFVDVGAADADEAKQLLEVGDPVTVSTTVADLHDDRMVGFDLAPDAVVAVDVTHATDSPGVPGKHDGPIELGAGPVIGRGSANHPILVSLAREAAGALDLDVQLQAAGIRTGTDADAFFTTRGGIPSLTASVPNRYMHTPVEVIDTGDLEAVADLLGGVADAAAGMEDFAVEI